MSLRIENLTKVYGQQKAVNAISFEVNTGEIVGFLGPNGAGKSTTMKIIAGYLPSTEGQVWVNGVQVSENPLHAKQSIGYLPEHNPLYLDLYVHEYLQFVGKLYGMRGDKLEKRIAEMVDLCGLTAEQNKRMEELSKGYRQRVGLAQALIHDPKVLILDEPTSGLDPNQLVEIRKLIKEVSRQKTVLFSTHIMQEVQALCDRVVVINKGSIVANDNLSNLVARGPSSSVIVEFAGEVSVEQLRPLTHVLMVEVIKAGTFRITATEGVDIRPEIFRFAADQKLSLTGLKQEENSLERIFQSLTMLSPEHSEN